MLPWLFYIEVSTIVPASTNRFLTSQPSGCLASVSKATLFDVPTVIESDHRIAAAEAERDAASAHVGEPNSWARW